MALRVSRVAGVGSNVAFLVPEGTDVTAWFPAQVDAYDEPGPTVPAQTEAAWVLQTAWCADLLMKPHLLTWSGTPADGSIVVGERTVPPIAGRTLPPAIFRAGYKVSNAATRRDWNPDHRAPGMSDAAFAIDRERARMALAQVSILREVVTGAAARARPAAAPGGTAAGEVFTVLVVGSVIIAAVALDAYFAHLQDVETLQSAADTRVRLARIAQAGANTAARLAQRNSTGTMPPPTELELAVASEVNQRARSEWENFWTGAERTASSLGKGLAIGGALLLAAAVAK